MDQTINFLKGSNQGSAHKLTKGSSRAYDLSPFIDREDDIIVLCEHKGKETPHPTSRVCAPGIFAIRRSYTWLYQSFFENRPISNLPTTQLTLGSSEPATRPKMSSTTNIPLTLNGLISHSSFHPSDPRGMMGGEGGGPRKGRIKQGARWGASEPPTQQSEVR